MITKKSFTKMWTEILIEDAKIYNGMYASIKKVIDGNSKNPDKVIEEWCKRTVFNKKDHKTEKLCKKTSVRLNGESLSKKRKKKWTNLFKKAIIDAGIEQDENKTLVLNADNYEWYNEWNGETLYVDDTVSIMTPAWFQKGKLIEKGFCTVKEAETIKADSGPEKTNSEPDKNNLPISNDEKMMILVEKTIEVLVDEAEAKVTDSGYFQRALVSFNVPDSNLTAILFVVPSTKEFPEERRIQIGVCEENSNRINSVYYFKGTKQEILSFLKDKNNIPAILEQITNLCNKASE